jgi:alpha-glucosidase (family GH31 glycosyl hydrolase)
LGNWWSRYHRYTEKEYVELVERFEREKIPFSVAVIDMDWHLVDDVDPKYGSGWTGYTWNKNFFPDPKRFLSWLHEHGMKTTLNVHPADGIRAYEEPYERVAEKMGIDPKSGTPVQFDPADPHFMEVYLKDLHHPLEEEGVDFWWLDWQQGTVTKVPGLDPLWMLNHYHYLDSKWKGSRALTFSRYAGVGSHRYPVGFSGDTIISWDSLKFQPYFTNTASNIGYGWWSHDIGGHMMGIRDDELMARWVQYGVFSPINRLHSTDNPFNGKEPWKFDKITQAVMEEYLRLRHGMVPYLYSMNRRASRESLPLIQPLYYLEPEQEEAYHVQNEYYFGTELLVSPITEKQDGQARAAKAETWLPEGLWADFFNGLIYHGGRMLDIWRGVEEMPVLMKAGAIVAMKDMRVYDNSTDNPKAMEVHIFPAEDGSFTLWEDEGDTPEDKEENWAATELTFEGGSEDRFVIGKAIGNLQVLPAKRSWKLVFTGVENSQATVRADGMPVNVKSFYEEETNKLYIEIPETDIETEIQVVFPQGLPLAEMDLPARCYKLLEKAQIAYDLKARILDVVKKQGRDSVATLLSMHLNPAVLGELCEILTA